MGEGTGNLKAVLAGAAGTAAGFFAGRAFQEATAEPATDVRATAPVVAPARQTPADTEMPPWIPQLLRRVALYIGAVVLAIWAARAMRDLLINLILAFFAALAFEPAVTWLHARGWRRGPATLAVMAAIALIGVLLLAILIPSVIKQFAALIAALPDWLQKLDDWVGKRFGWDISIAAINDELAGAKADVAKVATNVVGNLFGIGAAFVSAIFRLMTIGLFTFYFVADGPKFRRSVCSLLPSRQQELVLGAWEVAIDKTGGYLYSRLLLAAISAFWSWLIMVLLGVPFALPLALWVGFMSQFIPTFGTYIAMFVPLVVALFSDPMDALWLLIYFTIYQQLENYILSPRITAKTMELHPAVAFGSAMAGFAVAGPIGAFLALPVVATIQSGVLIYVVKHHEVIESELTEEEPEPPPKPVEETGLVEDIKARWRKFRARGKEPAPPA